MAVIYHVVSLAAQSGQNEFARRVEEGCLPLILPVDNGMRGVCTDLQDVLGAPGFMLCTRNAVTDQRYFALGKASDSVPHSVIDPILNGAVLMCLLGRALSRCLYSRQSFESQNVTPARTYLL